MCLTLGREWKLKIGKTEAQHPHYLLRFQRWISPTLPGGAQVYDLAWSHRFRQWHVFDRFSLVQDRLQWRAIARPQRLCVYLTDWLTDCLSTTNLRLLFLNTVTAHTTVAFRLLLGFGRLISYHRNSFGGRTSIIARPGVRGRRIGFPWLGR